MAELTDDRSLAGLCVEHNPKAEEELYTRYAARLYALCLRYCDNPDDAKDLLQDAFIKVLDKISSFSYRGEGSLYAWIRRITVNMAVNRIKRHRLRFVPLELSRVDTADEASDDLIPQIPERVLLKMISGLPQMQRAIFNMYCIDEYSHEEIARELGISEKGSASILSKAKAQLRIKVKDYIKQSLSR